MTDDNDKNNKETSQPQHTTDPVELGIAAQVSMWHKANHPKTDNKQETDVNNKERNNNEQPKNTK